MNENNLLMPVQAMRNFLKLESAGGIMLIGAAILAILVANSPLSTLYTDLLGMKVAVTVGALNVDKPFLLWINEGLMAFFFLLVGLEVKREVLEGQLSSKDQIALPAIGAIGGFFVPAAIYVAFNYESDGALQGWAIPSATDIAFALGVLALLGNRVPLSLKIFLTSLAIVDDLAAVLVIAFFYTANLSVTSLVLAAIGAVSLFLLNRYKVMRIAPYALIGIAIWICVLKSGIHATLTGLLVAMAIPMRNPRNDQSPLKSLEHDSHPWVAYLILPLFAFTNAGVPLRGLDADLVFGDISLGTTLGLFIGKQLGVFVSVWLAIRIGLATMPKGANWLSLYGVSILTGIGFTMSLFIGTLAFETGTVDQIAATRLGVLAGSTVAAVCGYLILRMALSDDAGEEVLIHNSEPSEATEEVKNA